MLRLRATNWFFVKRMKVMAWYRMTILHFWYWVFKWQLDADNDLVFSICNLIHFIKYKQSTLVKFGRRPEFKEAPKRLNIIPNPDGF
jgi:hypothetical protein